MHTTLNQIALIFISIAISANAQSLRSLLPQGTQKHFLQKVLEAGFKTCYGVMFDAGSSGTRVYVYSWPCREVQTIANIDLKQMVKIQLILLGSLKKVTPGIASFADSLDGIRPQLQPLIDFAKLYVPIEQLEYTPIMLGATAGMRTLNQPQQINMRQTRTLGQQNIETPCYHRNYQGWWVDDSVNYTLIGTGDTVACQAQIKALPHNDDQDCILPDKQCGINNTFQPYIDSTIEIYGTNGVQTAAQFWGLQTSLYKVFRRFFRVSMTQLGKKSQTIINREEPYIASDFFFLQYTYSLLKYGYRVPDNQIINAPTMIENDSRTWTLAGMFYQVSQIECQFDSPI